MINMATQASGSRIRRMAGGHTFIRMGKDTKEDGRKTKNREKVCTGTETETFMMATGRTIEDRAKAQ